MQILVNLLRRTECEFLKANARNTRIINNTLRQKKINIFFKSGNKRNKQENNLVFCNVPFLYFFITD